VRIVLLLTVSMFVPMRAAKAEQSADPKLQWAPDHRAVTFQFVGQECHYPQDMTKGEFPPAGAPPAFRFEQEWPVVAMHARWTVSTKGWPAKYRDQAIDIILMWACDAELYTHVYPEVMRSARFSFPPEYLTEAKSPDVHNLAETMRGKQLGYEITAKAGFGAADYTIRTKITVGLSEDRKTIFYHDQPEYISDHLDQREFVFAARDEGDSIRFDVKAVCVCSNRRLFRDEAMRRVVADSRYLVEQLYAALKEAPTEKQIEDYLRKVTERKRQSFGAGRASSQPSDR
jgi:hypothetical protein